MHTEMFNAYYINIYASILLLILLVILYIKRDVYNFSGRVFKYMIMLNIVLSILEGTTLMFDGIDDSFSRFMNYSLNFILFLLTPLIGSLWAIYLDFKIFKSIEHIKRNFYYLYPFMIGVVLLIINFFEPVLFSVSSNNIYSREPFILVNIITLYLLLVYVTYFAMKNRNKVNKKLFYGALLFLALPAIGGITQMMFYGVSTLYSMFALGIFSTYIILETMGTSRDTLTGLFTRVKSNEYINELIYRNNRFGVIMIDLDDFKYLNDTYGHNAGDKVLIGFGEILVKVFDKDAVVSRFGGDEFLIIQKDFESKDFDVFKKEIYKHINENIKTNKLYKKFKFSIGYSMYAEGYIKSGEELIIEADNSMYLNKSENKNFKRRKSDR